MILKFPLTYPHSARVKQNREIHTPLITGPPNYKLSAAPRTMRAHSLSILPLIRIHFFYNALLKRFMFKKVMLKSKEILALLLFIIIYTLKRYVFLVCCKKAVNKLLSFWPQRSKHSSGSRERIFGSLYS